MSEEQTPQGFIDVAPELDGQAAEMLAGWGPFHGYADGAAMLATMRADPDAEINGVSVNDQLVVMVIVKRVKLMNEILAVSVTPSYRGHGLGELALADAIRRAGKRPLVVECDEAMRPYFLKRGFKLVGKRKGSAGEPRYRLGAHAPRPKPPAAGGEKELPS